MRLFFFLKFRRHTIKRLFFCWSRGMFGAGGFLSMQIFSCHLRKFKRVSFLFSHPPVNSGPRISILFSIVLNFFAENFYRFVALCRAFERARIQIGGTRRRAKGEGRRSLFNFEIPLCPTILHALLSSHFSQRITNFQQ